MSSNVSYFPDEFEPPPIELLVELPLLDQPLLLDELLFDQLLVELLLPDQPLLPVEELSCELVVEGTSVTDSAAEVSEEDFFFFFPDELSSSSHEAMTDTTIMSARMRLRIFDVTFICVSPLRTNLCQRDNYSFTKRKSQRFFEQKVTAEQTGRQVRRRRISRDFSRFVRCFRG